MRIKKLFIVIALCSVFSGKAFCQFLVEDTMAIAAAIENGLTMYNQLKQAYETYAKTIEQLKEIKRQAENLDLSKYDWTKIDGILTLTDDYMTYYDQVDELINRRNMRFGDVSFSLRDVFDTDLYSQLLEEADDKLNPDNIDEYEQAAYASRHGMSQKHYLTIAHLEQELAKKGAETKVVVEKQQEQLPKMAEGASEIGKQLGAEENGFQAAQLTNLINNNIFNNTLFMADTLSRQLDISSDFYQAQMMNDYLRQANIENSNNGLIKYEPVVNERDFCGDKNSYLDINAPIQLKIGEIRF